MIIDTIEVLPTKTPDEYPYNTAVFRWIADTPLNLRQSVAILIGDNGEGKSTLLSAVAEAYGLDLRGGHGARRYSPPTTIPQGCLRLSCDAVTIHRSSSAAGYFHRGDAGRAMSEYMSQHGVGGYQGAHLMSSGQALRTIVSGERFLVSGLFILDEPESSLSLAGQLEFLDSVARLEALGSQVIIATHSPVVAKYASAQLLEIVDGQVTDTPWKSSLMHRQWTAEFLRQSP